jgi:hypothetical protein
MSEEPAKPPKVFISYSWSSPDHVQRVLDLGKRLMGDGIMVVIDRWDLKEGQDLHAFMEQMVTDDSVTHVIVVSDREYATKADKREKGVGKEALIISAEVYGKAAQTKFLPLVFETVNGEACLPTFMKGRFYVDMSTPEREAEGYDGLVRRLHGKPLHQKPALGKPPKYILEPPAVVLQTASKALLARNAVLEQKPFADAAIEDYFTSFAEALEALGVSAAGEEPLDERVMASINSFLPYRDEFVSSVEFLAAFRDGDHLYQAVFEFFEAASKYLYPPPGTTSWEERTFDNYRFILGELFIQVVAVLIRKKRFKGARVLLVQQYRASREHYDDKWHSFVVFHPTAPSLEGQRQKRLNTNWVSATAETLRSRATGHPVTFDEVMQAELVLFLASLIDTERTGMYWVPYTLLYRSRYQPPELFAKAESKRYFPHLKELFGVTSKDELLRKIAEADKSHNMQGHIYISNAQSPFITYGSLANLEKLDSRP